MGWGQPHGHTIAEIRRAQRITHQVCEHPGHSETCTMPTCVILRGKAEVGQRIIGAHHRPI